MERPILQPLALAKPDLRQFGGVRLTEGFDLDRTLTDFGLMSVFAEHILHESSDITRHIGHPLAKISSNLIPAYDKLSSFGLDARQAAQPRKRSTYARRPSSFEVLLIFLPFGPSNFGYPPSCTRASRVPECGFPVACGHNLLLSCTFDSRDCMRRSCADQNARARELGSNLGAQPRQSSIFERFSEPSAGH